MALTGMDIEIVKSVGISLGAEADRLDAVAATLDGLAGRSRQAWHGQDADHFRRMWSASRSTVRYLTNEVRDLGKKAVANADEQTRASASMGAGHGSVVGPDVRKLTTDLSGALGSTAEQRAAWWNGLSASERLALLAEQPGLVLQLDCLSPEQRTMALSAFLDDVAKSTMVAERSVNASLDVEIGVVQVGVDGTATRTVMADGSVEVSLKGELAVGMGKHGAGAEASVHATGSMETVYRFKNQAEADAFIKALLEAPTPRDFGDGVALASSASTYVAVKYAEVFAKYQHKYDTTKWGLEIEGSASAELKALGVESSSSAKAHLGGVWDSASGTTTIQFGGEASAKQTVNGTGAGHGGAGNVSMSFDAHHRPTTLSFTGSVDLSNETGATSAGNDAVPVGKVRGGASVDIGAENTVTATGAYSVDLRNPVAADLAARYAAAVMIHDVAGAEILRRQLEPLATVTVRQDVSSTAHAGFEVDALAAKIEGEVRTTTTVGVAMVRPPGGHFEVVR